MSVPDQTPYIIHNTNGISTVFAFEFYIIAASDVRVEIDGTEITSGFTVSGMGNTRGGEITFNSPPANGAVILIERSVPSNRLTDYQDNGDLLASTVNKDFDRLWMAIQKAFTNIGLALTRPLLAGPFNAKGYRISKVADPIDVQDAATKNYVDNRIADNTAGWQEADSELNSKINSNFRRSLRVPELSVPVLPSADQRKNKLLSFDGQGNPKAIVPESGSAADVLIQLAGSGGAGMIGLERGGTVQDIADNVDVLTKKVDWAFPDDAVGDGVADDTSALQAVADTGRNIRLNKDAKYKISKSIVLPHSESMQTIDGQYATIITDGNYTPFIQKLADGTTQTTTVRKNFFRLKGKAPYSRDSHYWDIVNSAFMNWSYGAVIDCEAMGFCNGFRAFGYTYAENIYSDDMRNAMYSCYSPGHNYAANVRGGVCAGDAIIIKGDYNNVRDIFVTEAGVQGENPGAASDNFNGAFISFAADNTDAGYNIVTNARCVYFGSAALSMSGKNNVLSGDIHFGSTKDGLLNFGDAIYIGGENNWVGDIVVDYCYQGISIGTNKKLHIESITVHERSTSGAYTLTTGTAITDSYIGKITSNIKNPSKDNELYIQALGLRIGEITVNNINYLTTDDGKYMMKITSPIKVDKISLNATDTASSPSSLLNISANAIIGEFVTSGSIHGTSLTVNAGSFPRIRKLWTEQKGTSGKRPIVLNATLGTDVNYWGDVTVIGNTFPSLNGTLIMNSFSSNSLSWYVADSTKAASVRYPAPITTKVN